MGELYALDPLLHPEPKDILHQNSQFVEHFYQVLTTSVKPPFAISIDGLWGTGKTTVMQMLKGMLAANYVITSHSLRALGEPGVVSVVRDQLKDLKCQGFQDDAEFVDALKQTIKEHGVERYKTVLLGQCKTDPYPVFWFNPWEYQDAENIVLAFLQRFAKNMFRTVDKTVWSGLKILGTVCLVGYQVALKALPRAIGDAIDAVSDLDKIEAIAKRLEKEHEQYDDLILAIQHEFRTLINAVSKKHQGKPVIIFFDDLDRCLPDKAIQLLEAVKNLFVVPRTDVIFICGIDTRVAKQFIKAHYEGIEETFAINYFRKIFNLTVSMPYYGSTEIHTLLVDYITKLYGWDKQQADALAKMVATRGLQAEMTSVRKYLNVIHNLYTFCQFNPNYQFKTEHDLVVHLLIVKEAWQPLYEDLVKEAMKNRMEPLSKLVDMLIEEDVARERPQLVSEQKKFLHDYFEDPEKPFHTVKLGNDYLLQYPTLG